MGGHDENSVVEEVGGVRGVLFVSHQCSDMRVWLFHVQTLQSCRESCQATIQDGTSPYPPCKRYAPISMTSVP